MTHAVAPRAPANKWAIAGTVVLSSFVVVMDVSIVNVAKPQRRWTRMEEGGPVPSACIRLYPRLYRAVAVCAAICSSQGPGKSPRGLPSPENTFSCSGHWFRGSS